MQFRLRRRVSTILVAVLAGFLSFAGVGPGAPELARAAYCPAGWTDQAGGYCTKAFVYTGAEQTWQVPAGVNSISVDMFGAAGGAGGSGLNLGGRGGRVQATLAVSGGSTLSIFVGGKGADGVSPFNQMAAGGFNGGGSGAYDTSGQSQKGGGGGGASDIRIGGNALNNRVLVAGAGGGGANCAGVGGNGGGLVAQNGRDCSSAYGGGGGTQVGGGTVNTTARGSSAGTLGQGGSAAARNAWGSSGGGGGYYGGGAGTSTQDHGAGYAATGGGGSSYSDPNLATSVTHTSGYASATGNGQVSITYLAIPSVTSFDRSVSITNSLTVNFSLSFGADIAELDNSDFTVTGTAGGCIPSTSGSTGTNFTIQVVCSSQGQVGLTLASSSVFLSGNNALRGPASNVTTANETIIDTGPPSVSLVAPGSPNKNATVNFTLTSNEALTGLAASDFSVVGTNCTVGTPSAGSGSAPTISYTIPVTNCADATSVTLTLNQNSVTDAASNQAPANAISVGPVVTDYTKPSGSVTGPASSKDEPITYSVTLTETVQDTVNASDFSVTGTGCQVTGVSGSGVNYVVTVSSCSDNVTAALSIKSNTFTDLAGNVGPASSQTGNTVVDRSLAAVTITSPSSPNKATTLSFIINLAETTSDISADDFTVTGSGCSIAGMPGVVNNASTSITVTLSGCVNGTNAAIAIKTNAFVDALGNRGPLSVVTSNQIAIDRTAPTLLSLTSNAGTRVSSSTVVFTALFSESIQNLTSAMFTISGGTSCNAPTLSGSGSSWTITVTGCSSGNVVSLSSSITTSVTDLASNPIPATTQSVAGVTVDTQAPTISSVVATKYSSSVSYQIQFSEEVQGFNASAITFAGSSATSNSAWTVSNFIQLSTTTYRFIATSALPDSGTISFTVSTSLVKDIAGNALGSSTVSGTDTSAVNFYFLPSFTIGTVPELGAVANPVAPNFILNARGTSITAMQISITGVQVGDVLKFTNSNSSTFGNITTATSAGGVLNLAYSSTQPTAAQWQAAVRAVTFETSATNAAVRTLVFTMAPNANFSVETGHFYEIKPSPSSNWLTTYQTAETHSYQGLQGYLVNITSAAEQSFVAGLANGSGAWLGLNDVTTEGTWQIASGPEQGTTASYFNWSPSEPNNSSDYAMLMTNGKWDDLVDTQYYANEYLVSVMIVEYGDSASAQSLGLKKTANLVIDSTPPTVSSVSSQVVNGTFVRGSSIPITIRFNENVVVTGTPRLTLETGGTDAVIDYSGGSGTNILTFNYVVANGHTTSDLAYVGTTALALNSGTIKDSAGNNATLTLPALNSANSLGGSKEIVIDASRLDISFYTPSTSATTRTLLYYITASDAVDCTSLSTSPGVDFDFVLIDSIDSITSANSNKTCVISLTSSVRNAQFGTSVLTRNVAFSINDSYGNPHSNATVGQTAVEVTIAPAATNKGGVRQASNSGNRPQAYEINPVTGLLPGANQATRNAMNASKIVTPPAGVPSVSEVIDITGVTNPTEALNAKKRSSFTAGDAVVLGLELHAATFDGYQGVSYFKSGSTWIYTGAKAIAGGVVNSEPVTFTQPGTYYVKMIVLPANTSFATSSLNPIARSGIQFGFNSIPTSSLPSGNQSVEWEITVTGSVNTVNPTPPSSGGSSTPTVTPTPTPTPTPTVTPTSTPRPTPSPTSTPRPTITPAPTSTPVPSITPTAIPTPTPSVTPTATPSATPTSVPTETAAALPTPAPTELPPPLAPTEVLAPLAIEIAPGEPVPNPALGASGDDSAPPQEFDPLASPESVVAVAEVAAKAVVVVASVAAAAAAAGAAAAAAGAAAGAASAASGAAAGAAGSASSAGSAGSAGSSSASSSSSSGGSANSSGLEGEAEGDGDIAELEVSYDQLELTQQGWGDRLAIFAYPIMTIFDRLSNRAAVAVARFSPLISKVITDGAYLRAIFGTFTALPVFAGAALGVLAASATPGEILTPPWLLLLAIALLGIFDALAGFAATVTYWGTALILLGSIPTLNDLRSLMAVSVIAIGPALLTTAFRNLRKEPAENGAQWWERIVDLAIAPFMAGWSVSIMVSVLPAVTGFTSAAANHVADFGLAIAAAAAIRVALEEFAARYYPARLNIINPTLIPDPPLTQRAVALAVKYGIWVLISGALIGPGWQTWVGSALFLLPTILSWYADRFPNVPWLWRVLPSGVPGLAFSILVAATTTSIVSSITGANPELAQWNFVLLPMPLLVISLLGMFGREGSAGEEKPSKKNVWVYRLGGIVMFMFTLRLVGII